MNSKTRFPVYFSIQVFHPKRPIPVDFRNFEAEIICPARSNDQEIIFIKDLQKITDRIWLLQERRIFFFVASSTVNRRIGRAVLTFWLNIWKIYGIGFFFACIYNNIQFAECSGIGYILFVVLHTGIYDKSGVELQSLRLLHRQN